MKDKDILICKKKLSINSRDIFLCNKSYIIDNIDNINNNITLNYNEFYKIVFDTIGNNFYGNINDYFYTKYELRQLKLESI